MQQSAVSVKPKKTHMVSQQRGAHCEQAMELERGHREAAQLRELRYTSRSSRVDASLTLDDEDDQKTFKTTHRRSACAGCSFGREVRLRVGNTTAKNRSNWLERPR